MHGTGRPVSRKLVWSHAVFGILFGGVGSIVIYATHIEPTHRPFFLFDARISYPYKSDTISVVVDVFVSLAFAVLCVGASELLLMRGSPGSKRIRLAQAALNGVAAFGYQIFVQQLSTVVAGKMRPNFLARCHPETNDYSIGVVRQSATPSAYSLNVSTCTAGSLTDELKAFPSGHSSTAATLTLFGMLYFGYTFYCRRPLGRAEWREASWLGRLWRDAQIGLIGLTVLGQFLWIWMVGVSRFVDNKHDMDDIVAGWMLGAFFAAWAAWETFGIEHRLRCASGLYQCRVDYLEALVAEYGRAAADRELPWPRGRGGGDMSQNTVDAVGEPLERSNGVELYAAGKATTEAAMLPV